MNLCLIYVNYIKCIGSIGMYNDSSTALCFMTMYDDSKLLLVIILRHWLLSSCTCIIFPRQKLLRNLSFSSNWIYTINNIKTDGAACGFRATPEEPGERNRRGGQSNQSVTCIKVRNRGSLRVCRHSSIALYPLFLCLDLGCHATASPPLLSNK